MPPKRDALRMANSCREARALGEAIRNASRFGGIVAFSGGAIGPAGARGLG